MARDVKAYKVQNSESTVLHIFGRHQSSSSPLSVRVHSIVRHSVSETLHRVLFDFIRWNSATAAITLDEILTRE